MTDQPDYKALARGTAWENDPEAFEVFFGEIRHHSEDRAKEVILNALQSAADAAAREERKKLKEMVWMMWTRHTPPGHSGEAYESVLEGIKRSDHLQPPAEGGG